MKRAREEGERLPALAKRLARGGHLDAAADLQDVLFPELCANPPCQRRIKDTDGGRRRAFCTKSCRDAWKDSRREERKCADVLIAITDQLHREGKGVRADEINDLLLTNDMGWKEHRRTFG